MIKNKNKQNLNTINDGKNYCIQFILKSSAYSALETLGFLNYTGKGNWPFDLDAQHKFNGKIFSLWIFPKTKTFIKGTSKIEESYCNVINESNYPIGFLNNLFKFVMIEKIK